MNNRTIRAGALKLGRRKRKAQLLSRRSKIPRKPANRKRGITTRTAYMRALKGTRGLLTEVARRLGISYQATWNLLRKPGWENVKEAYLAEIEQVGDLAEDCIFKAITSADRELATKNARWLLDRKYKSRGYGEKSQVTLEGGVNPLQVATIDVDTLNLPLEIRKAILIAIEEQNRRALPEPSKPDIDVEATEVDEDEEDE